LRLSALKIRFEPATLGTGTGPPFNATVRASACPT
jgi:hypothetical protein